MSVPVLIAAHADRGAAWASAVRRARNVQLRAVIDLGASGVEGIEDTLEANADAAIAAWSAGPRESSRLAERLVEHPAPSLLHPPPARPPLGTGVQVAHGWLSLAGVGALERLFSSSGLESVRLTVKGLPEGRADALADVVYHGLTVVLRLGERVEIGRAVLETEGRLTVRMTVDGAPWALEASTLGHGLSLWARTAEGDYGWSADAVSETLQRPRAEPRAVPVTPWAERCLAQLQRPLQGGDIAQARAALALLDAIEQGLERRLPPRRLPAVDTQANGLAALGLSGVVPPVAPMAAVAPLTTDLPLEATAYRLGLRPATHLTVPRQKASAIAEQLPGTVVRQERIATHDDRYPEGDPIVDLFAARDEATARRLAQLTASGPHDHLSDIGARLGYPACCVQAFATLEPDLGEADRRYAVATRTSVGEPWPAVLDDTHLALLPHVPCTYRCERSTAQAHELLAALAAEEPDLHAQLLAALGGPVLYFDEQHRLRFRGACQEMLAVAFDTVALPSSPSEAFAQLAGAIAAADRLVLTDGALTTFVGGERQLQLERTDPGLGILLPFSASA